MKIQKIEFNNKLTEADRQKVFDTKSKKFKLRPILSVVIFTILFLIVIIISATYIFSNQKASQTNKNSLISSKIISTLTPSDHTIAPSPSSSQTVLTPTPPDPTIFVGPSSPLTVDFNNLSSSYTVTPGTQVTLSWSLGNVSSCEAKEDWIGSLDPSGNKIIKELKSKNFFAIQCLDSFGKLFSKNVTIYIESIPPTQPETSLAIRKTLNALIIFTNAGEQLPDIVKNDLCESPSTNGFSYLSTWFKREASRYGILLSMTVQCYEKQIALPSDVVLTKDTTTAFGQAIPVPIDMAKTTDYLFKTMPSIAKYDLITVVHYKITEGSVSDLAPKKINYVFLTKESIFNNGQPNFQNALSLGLIKGVVHESLHNLGALDHYDYNNP